MLNLVGEVWTNGGENLPTVLLLHGGGQTRHSWRKTAEELAKAGFRAVCCDLRGHGDSDYAPGGDCRWFVQRLRFLALLSR